MIALGFVSFLTNPGREGMVFPGHRGPPQWGAASAGVLELVKVRRVWTGAGASPQHSCGYSSLGGGWQWLMGSAQAWHFTSARIIRAREQNDSWSAVSSGVETRAINNLCHMICTARKQWFRHWLE